MRHRTYLLWMGAASLLMAAVWAIGFPGWSTELLGLPTWTGPAFAILGLLRLRAAYRAGRVMAESLPTLFAKL